MTFNSEDMFKAIEDIQGPIGKKKFGPDERFWKLGRNENNQGAAVIRLMPNQLTQEGAETKLVPFVRVFEHNVKIFDKNTQKHRYFIEESPSTIKEDCAMSDFYYEVSKIDNPLAKDLKEKIKRKQKFITNITVVNDVITPGNNGKIVLWSYGVKLAEKFNDLLKPSKEDVLMGAKPTPLYDLVSGNNFNLRIKPQGEFLSYDSSEKGDATNLKDFKTNEEVEAYVKQGYDLGEWVSKDHYITYEEGIEKIHRLIDGTEYEPMLRAAGSFIYGKPQESTLVQEPIVMTQTQITPTKQTTPVQESVPVQADLPTSPAMDMSAGDDLDFLADM